jgi:aspartyl-tRNA(Asn)/glutamyl-tRNA(Gln) amidotransferase subunit B
MTAPYTTVVGLEVHVQLLTKTKLFCGCRNRFGLPPNSATCPVCLGLPGSLPVMNRAAFRLALRAALALNCQTAPFTKWDRKNYFYPDLPKNYQISQYDLPFSHDGYLEIDSKRVGIIRVHLEEDAGKSIHDGSITRVDLNRTGTPLLEIVSRPDIRSPEEAIAYLEEIRLMMRELGVSDCEMQEGSLRCDANVNIHVPEGDAFAATPLVEIKNLNSFRAVGRAIRHEAQRQYEEFQKDPANYRLGKLPKTTAGWDDDRGRTEVQRHKEEAADYRYFPEPDLVPVTVSEELLAEVRAEMGELPAEQRARLQSQYGLGAYDAGVLAAKGRRMVAYFEAVAAKTDGKTASNRLSDLVFPALAEGTEEIGDFPVTAAAFADFLQKTGPLTKSDRTDLFQHMLTHGVDVDAAMAATGIKPAEVDEAKLREAVVAAIAANPKAVADFKKGKDAAKMAIVGAVMKANKGVPNEVVWRLVDEELGRV